MNLDELETLAKKATPGKWNFTYTEPYEAKFIGPKGITVWLDDAPVHEFNSQVDNDANYIAAANPDTVLKLIAVARAAPKGCNCGIAIGDPRISDHSTACKELMAALEALNEPG